MTEPITIHGVPVERVLKKALKDVDPRFETPYKRECMVKIAVRDGMCCTYCKKTLYFKWMGKHSKKAKMATYEHLTPVSLGGEISVEDGALACQTCNTRRGNMPVELFRTRLEIGYYSPQEMEKRKQITALNRHIRRNKRLKRRLREQHTTYCREVLAKQGWFAYGITYLKLVTYRIRLNHKISTKKKCYANTSLCNALRRFESNPERAYG